MVALRKALVLVLLGTALCASLIAGSASADVLVSTGSAAGPFSRNAQNEPAVAIDPIHPNIVAAAANDNIDDELCNAGDDHDCPYTPVVNTSGIYFSRTAGASWIQPTY